MKFKFIALALTIGLLPQMLTINAVNSEETKNMGVTIYVYPAITDAKVLPDTAISSKYISDSIKIIGSPGEIDSASFVIHPNNNLDSVEVTISDFIGISGTLTGKLANISVIKNWYQAGVPVYEANNKSLTPELILKDDSLIKVEKGENYVKLTDGTYQWISQPETNLSSEESVIAFRDLPIRDSTSLQPVDIPAQTNKQFWITLNIPKEATPGEYTGMITLTSSSGIIGELTLNITIDDIKLLEPYLIYSIYYNRTINPAMPEGHISGTYVSKQQLNIELKDLIDHGISNPTCYQGFYDPKLLGEVLAIRNNLGLYGKPLYYRGIYPEGYQTPEEVKGVISLAESYGVPNVYFYGQDEANAADLGTQRDSWQAIRQAGGKIFAAGYTSLKSPPGNFQVVGDILDLFNCAYYPSASEAAQWHSAGHLIFNYSNPQFGQETPETYRRNYGLLLWQQDYDGAMNFAYQWGANNIWNDFDNSTYRDHVMAYPTVDGVIDTIQWEGFREGVNDVRYLTTLLDAIKTANEAGLDTSGARAWLAQLKASDLEEKDLDLVRSTMIDFILSLQVDLTP